MISGHLYDKWSFVRICMTIVFKFREGGWVGELCDFCAFHDWKASLGVSIPLAIPKKGVFCRRSIKLSDFGLAKVTFSFV